MPWEHLDIALNTNKTHEGLCPLLCHIVVSLSVPVASHHCSIPPQADHTSLTTAARAILCR